MENDILIDGIIDYTKDGKLKWNIRHETKLSTDYSCSLQISGIKEIQITFYYDYKIIGKSRLSISIKMEKNRLRNYKYITSEMLKTNRFKELSDLINKQLKRTIIV